MSKIIKDAFVENDYLELALREAAPTVFITAYEASGYRTVELNAAGMRKLRKELKRALREIETLEVSE